jgi:hypothetical protein
VVSLRLGWYLFPRFRNRKLENQEWVRPKGGFVRWIMIGLSCSLCIRCWQTDEEAFLMYSNVREPCKVPIISRGSGRRMPNLRK